MNLKYKDEIIKSVSLYEETIKPRPILSIVHPYVLRVREKQRCLHHISPPRAQLNRLHRYILVETDTWMYVLEKWRDGVAISRFKRKVCASFLQATPVVTSLADGPTQALLFRGKRISVVTRIKVSPLKPQTHNIHSNKHQP